MIQGEKERVRGDDRVQVYYMLGVFAAGAYVPGLDA